MNVELHNFNPIIVKIIQAICHDYDFVNAVSMGLCGCNNLLLLLLERVTYIYSIIRLYKTVEDAGCFYTKKC